MKYSLKQDECIAIAIDDGLLTELQLMVASINEAEIFPMLTC